MKDLRFSVRVTLETFPTSGNAGRLQCNNWCSVQKYEWAAFEMFLYNKPSRFSLAAVRRVNKDPVATASVKV